MIGKVLKIAACTISFGACCMVVGTCYASDLTEKLLNEDTSIQLGKSVSAGQLNSETLAKSLITKNFLSLDSLRKKSDAIKNIYLSYYYAGEAMASFRNACLAKMLDIAGNLRDIDATVDYKLSYLLYFSQVSNNQNKLLESARVEIVETIINRLSAIANGDKDKSQSLLKQFYKLLMNTKFGDFVPYDFVPYVVN
jgi:hypothetical protein